MRYVSSSTTLLTFGKPTRAGLRLATCSLLVPALATGLALALASPAGALPFSGELLLEIGTLRTRIPGSGEGVSNPGFFVITFEAEPAPGVPEPGALGLFALGFAAVGLAEQRRARA